MAHLKYIELAYAEKGIEEHIGTRSSKHLFEGKTRALTTEQSTTGDK